MLSAFQVYKALHDGKYIECDTKQKTYNATNMLLDLGFKHGDSGYSTRYAVGDISDELYVSDYRNTIRSWYCNPCITKNDQIEYEARISSGTIPYDDFVAYYEETMWGEDITQYDVEQLYSMI